MRLLLDTHVAVWSVLNDRRLSRAAAALISDPEHDLNVSVVVLWEIAIKRSLSRGNRTVFPYSAEKTHALLVEGGVAILSVEPKHAFAVAKLPPQHRDPFDRMLLAQSLCETFRLVTHDKQLAAYSDTVILV